jgi:hypothetical protein
MSIGDARRDAARAARARQLGIAPWMLDAAEAVGTSVISDLVADSRRDSVSSAPNPVTRTVGQAPEAREGSGGRGWANATPLEPPPGVNYVDALCDAADRADRADRLRQEMERRRALGGSPANPAPPSGPPASKDER